MEWVEGVECVCVGGGVVKYYFETDYSSYEVRTFLPLLLHCQVHSGLSNTPGQIVTTQCVRSDTLVRRRLRRCYDERRTWTCCVVRGRVWPSACSSSTPVSPTQWVSPHPAVSTSCTTVHRERERESKVWCSQGRYVEPHLDRPAEL